MPTIEHSAVKWSLLGMAQAHHPENYLAKADEWANWIRGDLDRYNALLAAQRDPKHAKDPIPQAERIEKWARKDAPKVEHESVAAVKGQEPPIQRRKPGRPRKGSK
jgi:hypothetical protein